MANNQNPMLGQPMRAPMGAGRNLGLPNQFFQAPSAWGAGVPQPMAGPGPGGPMQAMGAGVPQGPEGGWAQGSAGPSMDALLGGVGTPKNLNAPAANFASLGRVPPAGAPAQGAGGAKGQGMAPGMQQQIARLPGAPPLGGAPPQAPPGLLGPARQMGRGRPALGAGGQKAPGMQRQIAQLPGAPR
jgi:hypothetical protein